MTTDIELIRPRIKGDKIIHETYSKHRTVDLALRAGRRESKVCKEVGIGSVFYVKRGWATWGLSGRPITDLTEINDAVRFERKQRS